MSRLRQAGLALALFGVDVRVLARSLGGAVGFARDLREFRRLARAAGQEPPRLRDLLPALGDRSERAGTIDEYFVADLWAARHIFATQPKRHVDVGSRLDGLIGHLLTFTTVEMIDIRPIATAVDGLHVVAEDASRPTAMTPCESVSSIHALEHFGLGRYGDRLDPEAHVAGLIALADLVADGGVLYVAVPVGRERVMFNAHRVLSPRFVPSLLPDLDLLEFSVVVDGRLVADADLDAVEDLDGALGLYRLRRPVAPERPARRD